MSLRSSSLMPLLIAAAAVAGGAAPAVEFDGFGLGDLAGGGTIAADLDRIAALAESERLAGVPALAVAMPGPVDPAAAPVPLAAEVRSRSDRVDVAAGLVADTQVVQEGPARWMGRVGVSNDRGVGRESLELRTTVGNNAEWGLVGVEVGPRVERRLRKGVTGFLDGKADARAMRSPETGTWALPGTATDGAAIGVAASAGLAR
ncbi:MAG: hypothetical protein ACKON8_05255 [Planctomycetota bacterium]